MDLIDKRTETHACDCISRQAAIDTEGLDEEIRCEMCRNPMCNDRGCDGNCKYDEELYKKIIQAIDKRVAPLPSVQPEITDEQAIDHLQKSEWMQNHDRQMYEMGLKERLADDSGSYDALLPSAHPERKRGKWIHGKEIAREYLYGGAIYVEYENWHCSECGHTVKNIKWNVDGKLVDRYCSFCGADMRGEQDD